MNNDTSDDIYKINNFIFEFACANKFNSVVYAKLYKELIGKYAILDGLIDKEISSFLENFKEIHSCKATDDYAEFCRLNKVNEKRRALCAFIVELVNNDTLSLNNINNLIHDLHAKLIDNLMKDEQYNTCEEISENLFILYNCNYITTFDTKQLHKLKDELSSIIKSDVTSYKSFSKKLKFKLMDINDLISKKI